MIPAHIDGATKVIGYFAYNSRNALCDGDACIIAGSEEKIKSHLEKVSKINEKDIIRKTRFGEIIEGLKRGGAYAFDEESYGRFLHLAKINGMDNLPEPEVLSNTPSQSMDFIRIQIV